MPRKPTNRRKPTHLQSCAQLLGPATGNQHPAKRATSNSACETRQNAALRKSVHNLVYVHHLGTPVGFNAEFSLARTSGNSRFSEDSQSGKAIFGLPFHPSQRIRHGHIGMIELYCPHSLLVWQTPAPTLTPIDDRRGMQVTIRCEVDKNLDAHWLLALEARAAWSLQPLAACFSQASLRLASQPVLSDRSLRYCCEFNARNAAGATWHFRSLNEDPLVAVDDTIARVRRTATRFKSSGRQ